MICHARPSLSLSIALNTLPSVDTIAGLFIVPSKTTLSLSYSPKAYDHLSRLFLSPLLGYFERLSGLV